MKRNIVIAVVTAAALVGGGTATALAVSGDSGASTPVAQTESRVGDDDGRDDDGDDRDDRSDVRGDDRDDRDDRDDVRDDRDDAAAVSGSVSAADAIAAALKHTPGTAVSADLDDDGDDADDNGGRAAWEVDILGGGDTWYSVRVDPATGKVLGAHKDDEDDAGEVRAALKGASVTAEEAAELVAAKGRVVSIDLDDDERGWEAETVASGGGEKDWRVGLDGAGVSAERGDDSDGSDDSDDSDD
ncbi:PepSY domain-containing protein [Streptomyces capillispiralis]|uniref:PepSY domain-containing protein n=1 Tax=Streptomyces capillispiralis TaxID=68182 RepID=UPI0036B31868